MRWKTESFATWGAIPGTTWTALAPVPITATFLPVTSKSWFQRAVWKISPPKLWMPLMSGREGSTSPPTPETTTRAVTASPSLVCSFQLPLVSSKRASTISVPRRMCSRSPHFSTTRSR